MRLVLALCSVVFGAACITVPVTETLQPGQSEVGMTLGGPLIAVPGGGPTIPLPSITVEYRKGGGESWDWSVGTHLLPTAFGALGVHGGASYRLLDQDAYRPRLIVTNRLYLFSNHLDGRKPTDSRGFWANNELLLTGAWDHGAATYYVHLMEHLDLALPGLVLTPALGAKYRFKEWEFFAEFRWFGANADNSKAVLQWQGIGDLGAQAIGLGFSRRFGDK
jgi:hypothetical protein